MKKVAVLVPSFEEKGPLIVAKNITENIKDSLDVIYISLRNCDFNDFDDDYKCFNLGMGKFPTNKIISKLNNILRDESVDILHAHAFWPTIIASYVNDVKKVVTVHNNPFEDYTMEYGKIVGILMCHFFTQRLKFFNEVVNISNYVQRCISVDRDVYISSSVIHNGTTQPETLPLKKLINKGEIKFITVSALIPRKNIEYSLILIRQLIDNGFNPKLEIIGDGPLNSILKEQTEKLNISNHVDFLGSKSYSETMNYIRYADIFLFASLSEGFGLVLVEAMMNGTVVLAKRIDAVEEVVNNDSLIFDDYQDFERKLSVIICRYDYFQQWCLEHYSENYTSEVMASKYRSKFLNL